MLTDIRLLTAAEVALNIDTYSRLPAGERSSPSLYRNLSVADAGFQSVSRARAVALSINQELKTAQFLFWNTECTDREFW